MLKAPFLVASPVLLGIVLWAQAPPGPDPQPIYRVTVVSRTLEAVNYEHRSGPTPLDFQGTVLLPKAKGSAIVESKRGRVTIDVRFDHLEAPSRFGPEYLTYVLWGITPEGRAKNLGEILVDGSNKAHLSVTSDLQALGMIVTAEPYYSVSMPSDVVVLENIVRPDTIGMREEVTAKYDLLPRGQYTMTIEPGRLRTVGAEGEKLPYDRYEALLEVYQAENAVQIAQAAGADRFAPDTFNKAVVLLTNARNLQASKQDTHMIVSTAREAAQTAEDARTIAVKRGIEERQSKRLEEGSRVQAQAEQQVQQAQSQVAAAQAQADADRLAAERARVEADQARAIAAQRTAELQAERARAATVTQRPPAQLDNTSALRQSRAGMLAQLNGQLPSRDTPRGLLVTVPESYFEQSSFTLRPGMADRLARIARIVSAHPGLSVRVEGYTDDHGDQESSRHYAQAVRDALVSYGVAPSAVSALGYGRERPISSNSSPGGREQNRRVEIVVSGPSIGGTALWDRSYSLK